MRKSPEMQFGRIRKNPEALGFLPPGACAPKEGFKKAYFAATSVRNVGVRLVIVTAAFPGTQAVVAATAFALFPTIVMALIAMGWGRLVQSGLPPPSPR
jgi:hypothetical protein